MEHRKPKASVIHDMHDCCQDYKIKMELDFCSFCILSGLLLAVLAILWVYTTKSKKSDKTVPPGVVLLHQFKPHSTVVNLSPPCLKLETFLRMAKIPYECDYSFKSSSKGKTPWIEFNGIPVADSNFCIEFLSKEFKVDIDSHLTDEERGVATALLVMLEENTYWTLVYYRWLSSYAPEFRRMMLGVIPFPLRNIAFWIFQRRIRGYLYGHGIGRHSEKEIYGIAERDLRAVSSWLGKKKFLFGDRPSLVDAALFALVGNFVWQMVESPQARVIESDLKNLAEHANRMKELFYPDWDEITGPKKAKSA